MCNFENVTGRGGVVVQVIWRLVLVKIAEGGAKARTDEEDPTATRATRERMPEQEDFIIMNIGL